MTDDEIIALAVECKLGRTLRPIAPLNPPAFVTEKGYRTDELLDFARALLAHAAGVQPSANAAEVIDGMTRLIDQWHNGVKVPDMWMAAAAGALSAARALLADGVAQGPQASDGTCNEGAQ